MTHFKNTTHVWNLYDKKDADAEKLYLEWEECEEYPNTSGIFLHNSQNAIEIPKDKLEDLIDALVQLNKNICQI